MLATGLVSGTQGRARTLGRRSGLGVVGLVLAGLLAAGAGIGATTLVLAQGGASAEELVGRLAELERAVPTPLPPSEVVIADDQTWADFIGDFTGTKIQLDAVADDARQLFIDADEADGDVADAVSDVARAYVVLQNAFTYLAAWEANDLVFPLETFDETGTATGADAARGLAEVGFSLEMEAFDRMLPAYAVLRDTDAADADERALFDGRYETVETHHAVLIPNLRRALSEQTVQELLTVDRFQTNAPGAEARARVMTVVCIDRDALAAVQAGLADPAAAEAAAAALSGQLVTVDCPDLDNGNEIRPLGTP